MKAITIYTLDNNTNKVAMHNDSIGATNLEGDEKVITLPASQTETVDSVKHFVSLLVAEDTFQKLQGAEYLSEIKRILSDNK